LAKTEIEAQKNREAKLIMEKAKVVPVVE